MAKESTKSFDAKNDTPIKVLRTSRNIAPADLIFKIQSFSSLLGSETKKIQSKTFESGGYNWKLSLSLRQSKEEDGDYIALHLLIADINERPSCWEVDTNVKMFLFNHIKNKYLCVQDVKVWCFHFLRTEWGFEQFIPLSTLSDPSNGYLVDDSCAFGAEIYVIEPKKATFECIDLLKALESPIFTWKIKDYSQYKTFTKLQSPEFSMEGWKWHLELYPNGIKSHVGQSISLYLISNDVDSLADSNLEAKFKLRIIDSLSGGSKQLEANHKFCSPELGFGFQGFMDLKDLEDPKANNFLHGNSLVVQVEISYLSLSRIFKGSPMINSSSFRLALNCFRCYFSLIRLVDFKFFIKF